MKQTIATLLLLVIFPTPDPPKILHGYLSQYAQEPTRATIAYRQAVGDLPADLDPYAGVIAVADCSLIGREALLRVNGRSWPVIVFDCAGPDGTAGWMQRNRIVAEAGYDLARQLDIIGRGGIRAEVVIP